jgi:dipeptidyl aminopeptidase/acylaminoacyl peptidase
MITPSAMSQAAVYRRNGADGDRLILAAVGKPERELWHFNRHLAGLQPMQRVMLTRNTAGDKGDDEDLVDWLLLPPDYKPGERLPLVVYFYPDTKYSRSTPWQVDDLRRVNFLNQNILAGGGYAILLASMEIKPAAQAGDPMLEMPAQLIQAAENAVAQGYADPQRWAIMGHSFGGYGTLGVITQTARFKSAVALSGVYNITSHYGLMSGTFKVISPDIEITQNSQWAESGQGRMGLPPWQDPERYIRNSPLFHAGNIATPTLLIHGDLDSTVSVTESEQMFTALARQDKPVQFVRYWGEEHSIASPANLEDMWARILDWLAKTL